MVATATTTLAFNNNNCYGNNGFRGPPFATERQKRRVDRAFDSLEQEIRDRRQQGTFRRQDGEEIIKKQKEWVNKAFDFAKELNQDFSSTDTEAKQNEEDLEQVREWINRAYGVGFENKNMGVDDNGSTLNSQDSTTSTPNFEIRSTDEMFQVAVDAPGADRDEIDITIDDVKSVLKVEYERNGKTFAKAFSLDENVITTSISAELKNGVLMVSAPKKIDEEDEEEKTRKIPIL
uniref:SHSP domain-containing protein n=1 Tax=Grammatophora oceanica TaxID=210454 RepID=A0A7S1VHN6_9STRA